jgi:hypothetical protein
VIGGEFTYQLLHAVHPIAEDGLQGALRKLTDAELLYVRGLAPQATYFFKHALVRDAAYEALLKSRRKELHRRVARTIDEQFAALAEAHPEVLARHWTEAGETEPAIGAWSRAGEGAETRNAFTEALESYQQALALLTLLPKSPERDLRELKLERSIVGMLSVTTGYAAPETICAVERAALLAEKSGNLAELVIWAGSRCVTATISGDFRAGVTLADQTLELALREGSTTSLAGAYALQMVPCVQLGNLAGAEKHFTRGLAFFDDPGFRHNPLRGFIVAFSSASDNAWLLGRADAARERMAQLMAGVDRNNPYDLAFSGYAAARLSLLMRRIRASRSVGSGGARAIREKSISEYRGDVPMYSRFGARAARPRRRGHRTDSPRHR